MSRHKPADGRGEEHQTGGPPSVPASPDRTQRERPYQGRPFILGSIHPSTNEIRELAETLGLDLVVEVYQPRPRPHPGAFFGKGRLATLRTGLDEWRAGIQPAGWAPHHDHWLVESGGGDGDGEAEDGSAWGGTAWTDHGPSTGDALGGADAGAPDAPEQERGGHRLPPWRDNVLMILDEDVRPAVLFNLEERLGIEVWDRTRLILEIFSQHAHVKEAKLQVELAKLQYEIPLIHEAVHRRRSGERPGFRGGGEYGVADYEDFIKRRMRTVKTELEHIRKERDVRRKVRREGFYLVSLAGYTNAGKSSLLNALTGAGTLSEDTLFSTLATTTRRMVEPAGDTGRGTPWQPVEGDGRKTVSEADQGDRKITSAGDQGNRKTTFAGDQGNRKTTFAGDQGNRKTTFAGDEGNRTTTSAGDGGNRTTTSAGGESDEHPTPPQGASQYERPVLLTDTVGFIQALPSWLLDAFHSTLEEISVSDVVLLVADVADPVEVLVEKVRVCRKELAFLDVTSPIILALNKSDLVPERAVHAKMARLQAEQLARPDLTVTVSSLTGDGVPLLVSKIQDALPPMIPYEAIIPSGDGGQRLASRIYEWGSVTHIDYGTRILVRATCDPLYWKSLLKEGMEAGARIARVSKA